MIHQRHGIEWTARTPKMQTQRPPPGYLPTLGECIRKGGNIREVPGIHSCPRLSRVPDESHHFTKVIWIVSPIFRALSDPPSGKSFVPPHMDRSAWEVPTANTGIEPQETEGTARGIKQFSQTLSHIQFSCRIHFLIGLTEEKGESFPKRPLCGGVSSTGSQSSCNKIAAVHCPFQDQKIRFVDVMIILCTHDYSENHSCED